MGSDVDGVVLGEEFKGYTFRITGGNDKQGFAMKQGILVNGRVRILMKKSKFNYYESSIQSSLLGEPSTGLTGGHAPFYKAGFSRCYRQFLWHSNL